jgi:hypothetical protein
MGFTLKLKVDKPPVPILYEIALNKELKPLVPEGPVYTHPG